MAEHRWKLTEKRTNSGKAIYRCDGCGWELPAPAKGKCGTCESCELPFGSIGHHMQCLGLTIGDTP